MLDAFVGEGFLLDGLFAVRHEIERDFIFHQLAKVLVKELIFGQFLYLIF